MKSISSKICLWGFLLMGVASLTQAQGWPKPAKTPRTDVLCNTRPACDGETIFGKKLIGYPPLLTTFSGRFLDSVLTRDYQFSFRTARTRGTWVASDRNRIYMIIGSAVAAYDIETFFTRVEAGEPLMPATQVQVSPPNYRQGSPEVFLNYDRFFYAESGGGWAVPQGDGQERLFGLDWDDRGLVYLAYGAFSWGAVRDDGGKGGSIMPTVYQDKDAHDPTLVKNYDLVVSALTIVSLKGSNGSYYVLASGAGNGKTNVYDVTALPAGGNPIRGSNLPFEITQFAKSADGRRVAVTKVDGSFAIYEVDTLVRGGGALLTVPGNPQRFGGVTTDGTNFFTSAYSQAKGLTISAFKPSGSTYAATITLDTGLKFNGAPSIRFGGPQSGGSQFLTVVGVDLAAVGFNARLYKVGPDASSIQEIPELENYIAKHYSSGAPAGYTGPAYSYLADVVIHRSEKTKKYYMIVDNFGLGDVYELRAGESIKASIKSKQRTANPNSKAVPDSGPYYGDEITFTSQTSNAQPPVSWTFSDGGFANTTASNPDVKYQFGGVSSSTQLPATRQVTATSLLDASLVDTLTVTLKKPEVRIGLKGTTYLFKQPDASSPVPIVSSDFFTDASDGSDEGHYSEWKRDSTSVLLIPSNEFAAGGCGERTLYFVAHYGPYAGSSPNITPIGAPADIGINGITHTIRPVAASVGDAQSSGSNVTFASQTRATTNSGDLTPGALVNYTWELLRADLVQAIPPVSGSGVAAGAIPAFVIPKSTFQGASNWRVRLTVTAAAANLSAGCQPYAVSKADSHPLSGPLLNDIVVTGCANAGSGCSMSASVPAGTDTTGWSYAWSITGPTPVIGGSSATYSPSFVTAGTYFVTLVVSNAIGTATLPARQLTLAAPLCSSSPNSGNMGMGFQGKGSSGCSNGSATPCAPGEQVQFTMSPFGWVSGSCDTYLWNFGDGGTSTERSPTHAFNTPGSYGVTLKVVGGLSTGELSKTVVVGSSTPPPPPPPPPPTGCGTMVAEQNVYITYQGSGACIPGGECKTSENIAFGVQSYGYNMNCGTHSFQWSFSDGGGGSSSSVAHAYSTAGNHTVSVTINNGVNSVTLNKQVKVTGAGNGGGGGGGGGSCPQMVAGGTVYIGYTGAESNCTASSGGCKVAENVNFTASSFGYNYGCSAHTFAWTFGDGGSSPAQNPTHIFNNPGTYNVKLIIKNSQQEVTMEKLVSVGGGNPVGASVTLDFTFTKLSADGKVVMFTAVADPASAVKEYLWNFGDGSPAISSGTTPQAAHPYVVGGKFNATVTAKSATGATLATKTREVDISTPTTTRRRGASH